MGSKHSRHHWRLGRASRRMMRIIVLFWILIVLVVLFPAGGFKRLEARFVHRRGQRVLAAAQTPEAVRAAVGKLGAVFTLRDGSWIAIRYADQHGMLGYSCANARDSSGRSFFSDYHFCGRFAAFRKRQSEAQAGAKTGASETNEQFAKEDPELFALAASTNLVSARVQLVQLGFIEE